MHILKIHSHLTHANVRKFKEKSIVRPIQDTSFLGDICYAKRIVDLQYDRLLVAIVCDSSW
jgi:hypothetical protein